MARSSTALPQLPLEGELIKGPKKTGARKKTGIAKPEEPFTAKQWNHMIAMVANRVLPAAALEQAGITRYALDAAIRGDAKRRGQWEDAKLAALRLNWDVDTLEDIMVDIAMGSTVKAACEKAFRGDTIHTFYKLVLKDPVVKEMYDEARQIQAEKMAIDDLIEIADDDARDETWDGKGNSAAVNRSRLKVDARKWAAAKLHYKRFGDKVQQDVNANIVVDHAARLEAARRRKAGLGEKDDDE